MHVGLEDWLKRFAALHERAREGKLSAPETRGYLEARGELAYAIMRAQQLSLRPGLKARQALRASAAMSVSLVMPEGPVRALTQDLSTGGFSAIVGRIGRAPPRCDFSLTLSKAAPPVEGSATIVAVAALGGSSRFSFAFDQLPPAELERVEMAVFDCVLAQIGHLEKRE
jgi:hypothetical protein